MPTGGLYVTGLRETVRAFEQAGADLDDLKDAMGRIASTAADTMQGFTPRVSGTLRASVRGNRAKGSAVVLIGGARVPYAGPIAYGWPKRNIKPGRFIERTDRVMEEKAPDLLEAGWDEIARRNGLT